MNDENNVQLLLKAISWLSEAQVRLLVDMAVALRTEIEQTVDPSSDILSPLFVDSFANRLRLFHATNAEKLNKKSFEYAFVAASKYAGRKASLAANAVGADYDALVDGVKFSLKTEAEKRLDPNNIKISKFSEARWIRDCKTTEDFAREATQRIAAHLAKYERILTWRAFDVAGPAIRYDLYEIPKQVLLRVTTLKPENFAPRSPAGGTSATVTMADGRVAYRLVLDGSVEKVTISNLSIKVCRYHGSWVVPITPEATGSTTATLPL